jgi:hypothetical protein
MMSNRLSPVLRRRRKENWSILSEDLISSSFFTIRAKGTDWSWEWNIRLLCNVHHESLILLFLPLKAKLSLQWCVRFRDQAMLNGRNLSQGTCSLAMIFAFWVRFVVVCHWNSDRLPIRMSFCNNLQRLVDRNYHFNSVFCCEIVLGIASTFSTINWGYGKVGETYQHKPRVKRKCTRPHNMSRSYRI